MNLRSLLAIASVSLITTITAPVLAGDEPDAAPALPAGVAEDGEASFKKCLTCHTTEEGGKNKVGPNLWRINGRVSGTVEKFRYSKGMTEAAIVWDVSTLNPYLLSPRKYVKGGKMAYPGEKNDQKRADLIAYLLSVTGGVPAAE
ncbi:MAG: cytochrome c family protein [Proteobacteria bacterium]|nr:cytochrome c family protein [Pseudomonadota bacterium]